MKAKGGRAAGVPNYQNDVLINVIEAVLPDGPLQWSIVAQRYQEASGEREIRDGHDIKRHFTTHKNLCNNGKKVTGSSAPKPQVARCQDIWQKILRKSAASNCGGGSSSDDMSETENERESFVDEKFDDDTQFDDNEYAESTENLTDNNDEIPEPRDLPPRVEAQRGIAQLVEAHRLSVLPPRSALDRPIEGHRAPSPLPRVTLRLEGPRIEGQRAQAPSPVVRNAAGVPPLPPRDRHSRTPSPAPNQQNLKRGAAIPDERGKSKNCRNNPRGSAGAALASLADAYAMKQTANANEPSMSQVMMMNMQMQQQSQEQARQQQQQQFQIMMMYMMNNSQNNHHSNNSQNDDYSNSHNNQRNDSPNFSIPRFDRHNPGYDDSGRRMSSSDSSSSSSLSHQDTSTSSHDNDYTENE